MNCCHGNRTLPHGDRNLIERTHHVTKCKEIVHTRSAVRVRHQAASRIDPDIQRCGQLGARINAKSRAQNIEAMSAAVIH